MPKMTSNLKENYNRAATLLKGNDSKENTTLIHRTPWVRIMLEQDQEESGSFFLEVEMSLPESTKKVDVDSSELIDTLSEHLQYLNIFKSSGMLDLTFRSLTLDVSIVLRKKSKNLLKTIYLECYSHLSWIPKISAYFLN
jgi:hypothetical protein